MKPALFLPIDVHVREALAKTLLAAAAARAGFNVVIGRKKEVTSIARSSSGGIFLGIGAQANFERQYDDLSARGIKVVVMDEEGLVTFSDEIYARTRLAPATLGRIDSYFTWGEHHDAVVRSVAPTGLRVVTAGNLRFDVLKPGMRAAHDRQVAALRSRLGDYVLVVSSFAACNHFSGTDAYLQSLKEKKFIRSAADEAFFRRYIAFKRQVMEAFLAALPALARTAGDAKIVLRPHPSENIEPWVAAAMGHGNFSVESEGDVQPLILASRAIIHHYCTTSIEALAADHPAIAFRPFVDPEIETDRPYACSLEARSEAGLIAQLRKVLAGTDDLSRIRDELRPRYARYVANMGELACWEEMVAAFTAIEAGRSPSALRLRFDSWRRSRRAKPPAPDNGYLLRKSPDISEGEMKLLLDDLKRAVPTLGRVRLRTLDNSCFLMTGS